MPFDIRNKINFLKTMSASAFEYVDNLFGVRKKYYLITGYKAAHELFGDEKL